jgi:hypothetical protein
MMLITPVIMTNAKVVPYSVNSVNGVQNDPK